MPEIEKLTLNDPETQSSDIVAGNVAALQALFPEAFSEGRIDFEVLKQVLGGAVDERDEKYGLNWHGKRRARQIALTPSTGTLLPCPQDSVDWDTTQNLMIEGDNLEVLKLLQKSYAGKVKMIYIDPPYNTGKDFVYPDDFRDGIKNYLELTGQTEGGRRINSNTDSSGRFHTDWLNMIYPRIKVARNLLSEDGVIFISIDDNEVDRLRFVCDEIFGEENFVAQFVWNTEGHTDNQFDAKIVHEYVVTYAKNADIASLGHVVDPNTRAESNLWKGFAENSITKNGPANPPSVILLPSGFPCVAETLDIPKSNVGDAYFEAVKAQGFISRDVTDKYDVSYPVRLGAMQAEGGKLVAPCKVFSGWANANKLKAFIDNDCQPILDGGDKVSFYLSPNGVVYYRRDREKARNILSVLRNFGTTEKMRAELERDGIIFQYPKPKEFVNYLVQIGCPENGIVLDFFAGSGTISQACFEQNAADKFSRRLIVVQLPEPTRFLKEDGKWEESLSWKAGFKTIFDITRKRLLRAGENIRSATPLFKGDLGFRVYKLASSNIRAWEADLLIGEGGVEARERDKNSGTIVSVEEGDIALPDVLTDLQDRTQLTRKSLVDILTGCGRLNDFKRNPQAFIEIAGETINRTKRLALVDGIKYQKIGAGEYYAQELFQQEELMGYLKSMLQNATKSVFEHVIYDSGGIERTFAEQLEKNEAVKIYAKLPAWFKVPTPLGTYNPDWAVLVEAAGEERLYFVVETKGSLFADDLRDVEAGKIACGNEHFSALAEGPNPARYIKATKVDDLMAHT